MSLPWKELGLEYPGEPPCARAVLEQLMAKRAKFADSG